MTRLLCASLLCAALATLGAPATCRAQEGLQLTAPPLLENTELSRTMEPRLLHEQLLFSGVTALVAVPAAMGLGSLWGRIPSNLIAAALPAVLFYLVVPPLATAWVARLIGSESQNLSPGLFLPALAGFGVHLAATAVGVLLNVSTSQPWLALLLAVVDAVAMTPATVFAMNALAAPRAPAPMPAAPAVETPAPAGSRELPDARPLFALSIPF